MQKLGKLDCIPPPRPKRRSRNPYPKNREAKKREAAAAAAQLKAKEFARVQGEEGNVSNESSSWASSGSIVPQTVTPSVQWQMVEQQQSQELQHKQLSQAQLELQQAISDAVTKADKGESNGNKSTSGSEFPPRFSKVYSFLGSLFDPSTTGHLDELEKMSQVDREIIQVLMRNLASNLEEHIKMAGGPKQGVKAEPTLSMGLQGNMAQQSKSALKSPPQGNLDKISTANAYSELGGALPFTGRTMQASINATESSTSSLINSSSLGDSKSLKPKANVSDPALMSAQSNEISEFGLPTSNIDESSNEFSGNPLDGMND
mmetsp:Transcript_18025/g.25097  ORF Transcript_18025/g.25097 Transcript_18025/m.25097 type:complete len:318 (+) Transcript_18025:237-1190(+)